MTQSGGNQSAPRREHQHRWGGSRFIGGLEIQHCEKDCPATRAKNGERWMRVDSGREES